MVDLGGSDCVLDGQAVKRLAMAMRQGEKGTWSVQPRTSDLDRVSAMLPVGAHLKSPATVIGSACLGTVTMRNAKHAFADSNILDVPRNVLVRSDTEAPGAELRPQRAWVLD